jgi:hypothetical protein
MNSKDSKGTMVITPETKLENFLISSEFKIMYPEDRKDWCSS